MSEYNPDNWVIIKFPDHYRVLGGWSGGYLTGNSWRMNSGITDVDFDGEIYGFRGSSGSWYRCHKNSYCLRMNNTHVWEQLQTLHGDKVELMPEDTDWFKVDWMIE